jgi:hypothetical protein
MQDKIIILAEKFKYLGMAKTNQNVIHEEIRSRSNSGMFATSQFRIFVFSFILYNLKIKNTQNGNSLVARKR